MDVGKFERRAQSVYARSGRETVASFRCNHLLKDARYEIKDVSDLEENTNGRKTVVSSPEAAST